MKNLTLVLTTTLIAASAVLADDGQRVRYRNPSGQLSLTVSHSIDVEQAKPVATRNFAFDLALATSDDASAVTVTIDKASGSYTAHGMKEQLGTRHLVGQSFPIAIGDGGRRLETAGTDGDPIIDLGPMIPDGFSIAALLVDTLPVLPEEEFAVGAAWTTERPVRSLEGWAWGMGRLTSRHTVTAVDQRDGHTIVSVETEGDATLSPVEGQRSYEGKMTRTLRWTFDATDGRMLRVSLEQESDGVCELPQGDIPIVQHTRIELAPPASS
jgi:hypothetical protein